MGYACGEPRGPELRRKPFMKGLSTQAHLRRLWGTSTSRRRSCHLQTTVPSAGTPPRAYLGVLLGVGHRAVQVVRINELQHLVHDARAPGGHAINDITVALQDEAGASAGLAGVGAAHASDQEIAAHCREGSTRVQ